MEKSEHRPQLNPKWTSHLPPEQREEIEKRLRENKDLLEILYHIVVQKIEAVQRERRKKSAYDKPAFSEFQADCNGYERALEEVLTYLKLTKEN
jgi:hypothetical protein